MNNHNHHEVTQGKILLSIHFCLTDTGLIFLRKTEKEEKVSRTFCEGEKRVMVFGFFFFHWSFLAESIKDIYLILAYHTDTLDDV